MQKLYMKLLLLSALMSGVAVFCGETALIEIRPVGYDKELQRFALIREGFRAVEFGFEDRLNEVLKHPVLQKNIKDTENSLICPLDKDCDNYVMVEIKNTKPVYPIISILLNLKKDQVERFYVENPKDAIAFRVVPGIYTNTTLRDFDRMPAWEKFLTIGSPLAMLLLGSLCCSNYC